MSDLAILAIFEGSRVFADPADFHDNSPSFLAFMVSSKNSLMLLLFRPEWLTESMDK